MLSLKRPCRPPPTPADDAPEEEAKRRRLLDLRRVARLDSIIGMFVGALLGDVQGGPKFMGHRNPALGRIGPENVLVQKSGHRHEMGQVTDDTEISVLILRLLVEGRFRKNEYVQAMHDWYRSDPICCGKNTKALFSGTPAKFDTKRAVVLPSNSNGFLMCCWPFSLVEDDEERRRCLRLHSDVVCPSGTCLEMCTLYCDLLRICVRASTLVEAKLNVRTHLVLWLNPDWGAEQAGEKGLERDAAVEAAVRRAMKPDMDDDFQKLIIRAETKGKAATTFALALWAFLHHKTVNDGLVAVLRLKGDTDTNATVTGALLGAAVGEKEALSGAQGETLAKNFNVAARCQPAIVRKTKGGEAKGGEVRTPRPEEYSWVRMMHSDALEQWIEKQQHSR